MTKNEIVNIAKTHLAQFHTKPGAILYSSHETLKPGSVYLLGFNPGGSGGPHLNQSIEKLLTNEENSYLDECWANKRGTWKEGEAPLQERVCWVLENLGLNPREVCASNLIFLQSQKAIDIDYALADICWPVHEALLEIVKPRMILVFGNSVLSPYGYLHSKYGGEQDYIPSGHGNWKIKCFRCVIGGKDSIVAGLPHLSRYKPIGKKHVIQQLNVWLHEQPPPTKK